MKEFNKDIKLKKLRLKNNKSKYIKYTSIIVSCVILLVGIIYFTFAKFESNKSYTLIEGRIGDYTSGDITLSYVVDGNKQDTPPGKNDGYIIKNVNCTNATGEWDSNNWWLIVKDINGKAKCNLEFEEAQYNNVTKWLATASINKSYTTLSEVFNDTDTLNTLTNNNASCDYLKNSTDWISDVTTNENAMTYIGNNDYCADDLYFDDNWVDQIVESTYWDKVLQPLVPTMTSNTTPSGEVFASGYFSSFFPYKAFDGSGLGWQGSTSASGSGIGEWLAYEFSSETSVKKVKYNGFAYYQDNHKIKVQASNDNSTWFDLTDEMACVNGVESLISVDNNQPYKSYRIILTYAPGGTAFGAYSLQFYGRFAN